MKERRENLKENGIPAIEQGFPARNGGFPAERKQIKSENPGEAF